MLDPDERDKEGIPLTARAAFIIGPDKRLKLSVLYPATTGRNFCEASLEQHPLHEYLHPEAAQSDSSLKAERVLSSRAAFGFSCCSKHVKMHEDF